MSSPTDSATQLHVEKLFIRDNLNAEFLLMLLFGAYTTTYIGTVYVYAIRRTNYRQAIILVLTILYLSVLVPACATWWISDWMFVDHGETRQSIYNTQFTDPNHQNAFVGSLCQFVGYFIADGLLVWRCRHMCIGNLRLMIIPVILFSAEIGLCICTTVFFALVVWNPRYGTHSHIRSFDDLGGALGISTAATSLSSTIIICRRIWISSGIGFTYARRRYMSIFYMLIESSAVYSIISIVQAASYFFTGELGDEVTPYTTSITQVATGIIPTLMVARIALTEKAFSQPNTLNAISGLQFHNNLQNSHGFNTQDLERSQLSSTSSETSV